MSRRRLLQFALSSLLVQAALPARSVGQEKRTFAAIITDVNKADKDYSATEKLIVERARYFAPQQDATIRGWVGKLASLSDDLAKYFREWLSS